MILIKRLLLFCFVILVLILNTAKFLFADSQQFVFKQISIESGLPGQNIRQVYQDYNGIIWLSVEAIGLCRYDGREFELYSYSVNDKNSISSNYVNSIIEDHDSNLWIATEKGLNKYIRSKNSFKRYYSDSLHSNGLQSNLIISLYIDNNKTLWVGTGNGLFKYNSKTDFFEHVPLLQNEQDLSINAILEHSSGNFFVGTNKGIIQFNPASGNLLNWYEQSLSGNGPIHQNARSIVEDKQGNLWIATHRGISVFYYNNKQFKVWEYTLFDKGRFENEGYNYVYLKDDSTIWFASYTNGIVAIDIQTNNYQIISYEENTEQSILSNNIRHIFKDKSGLLWIATKFEGVFIYDRRKEMFNSIPQEYGVFQAFKNMHILSFYNDTIHNEFWVGTKYEGLFKVDLKSKAIYNFTHHIDKPNSIKSNRIHEVLRDSENNLWVGLESGLDLFDEKNNSFIHYGNFLVDDIIEDKFHTIWVATGEGVFVLNKQKQKLERYNKNSHPFFNNDAIQAMDIYKDGNEQLWFATRNSGMFMLNFETNSLVSFSSKHADYSLKGDAVRIITEDKLGNILIGTKSDGLCIYDPQKTEFKYYSFDDGLPSDFILSIQQDFNGDFWLGTHNGLSKFDYKRKTFSNYNTVHGLQNNIFEHGACSMFKDGYLIFGGHNGINLFHPNKISLSKVISDSILITSFKAHNVEILRDVYKDSTIELNSNQNYITVDFVLSDYVDPLNHTFKYRIPELSEDWHELGNKNYVAFSNLNPGIYHLQIIGINEYGIPCDSPLELAIRIKPSLMQSWWFRMLIVCLCLVLILSVILYRVVSNQQTRKYLESEILERTEKIRMANTALIAQNKLIESQKQEIERNQASLESKVIERTKDLEKAKLKAEEADRLKSSFLANMSHEIRTPLNSIIGFSSLIVDAVSDNKDFNTYGNIISESSDMLLKIIDDILDISKLEAGQLEVQNTEVNLNQLISEIFNTFQEQIKLKKSETKLVVFNPIAKGGNLIIFTDLVRLKQIFFNLLSNAVKFTNKGYIEFGFESEDNFKTIKLFVKDTGIGIKQQYLTDVFNRFVKVEVDDILYRGNGLGLSLCKSLTQLMGGTIWVNSVENEGSEFYFTILSERSYIEDVTEL